MGKNSPYFKIQDSKFNKPLQSHAIWDRKRFVRLNGKPSSLGTVTTAVPGSRAAFGFDGESGGIPSPLSALLYASFVACATFRSAPSPLCANGVQIRLEGVDLLGIEEHNGCLGSPDLSLSLMLAKDTPVRFRP